MASDALHGEQSEQVFHVQYNIRSSLERGKSGAVAGTADQVVGFLGLACMGPMYTVHMHTTL